MNASQPLRRALREAQARGQGILAANFYNLETLQGILEAARRHQAPVILQLTRSSLDYMGLPIALAMARAGIQHYGVKAWVHLDHAASVDLVSECLAAGFDSVMFDGSELPFEENLRLTRKVVKLAARTKASVEAELGFVAKLGQEPDPRGLTDPAEAARFVAETGVDALAVSIGTAHGFYKAEPVLDMERLSAIRAAVDVPLVLHGGSGLQESQIREAVHRGVCKVNIATETKNAFVRGIKRELAGNRDIDLRTIFPPAILDVANLISEKLRILGAEASDAP